MLCGKLQCKLKKNGHRTPLKGGVGLHATFSESNICWLVIYWYHQEAVMLVSVRNLSKEDARNSYFLRVSGYLGSNLRFLALTTLNPCIQVRCFCHSTISSYVQLWFNFVSRWTMDMFRSLTMNRLGHVETKFVHRIETIIFVSTLHLLTPALQSAV